MYIAVTETGQRVRPDKELRKALCQCCNETVIAKTGMVKSWHWAHTANSCAYSKGKGEWHYKWQNMLDVSEVEVRDPLWPNNIADICIRDPRLPDGYLVVELQQSPISDEDVYSRTTAYRNILWIVNTTDKALPRWAYSEIVSYRVVQCNDMGEFSELEYSGHHYRIGFKSSVDMKEFLIQLYFKSVNLRQLELQRRKTYLEKLQADIDKQQLELNALRIKMAKQQFTHIKFCETVDNSDITANLDDSILAKHQLIYNNGMTIKLKVSYNEKDTVKVLGARWEPQGSFWYIPRDFEHPINAFAKWIDSIID